MTKWLTCVLVFVSLVLIDGKSLTDASYMEEPFIPVYPCVIMVGPDKEYVLLEPGGEIIAQSLTNKEVTP